MRYWDDFAVGQVYELGSVEITTEDIVDFAKQWDPQPFHLDDAAGRETPFDGIIASGWHTASAFMRLYVDNLLLHCKAEGGFGVDELRWLKPVRPGDVLTARATIEEVRASTTRPRGTVRLRWEMFDQHGEPVIRMYGINLFGRRPAAESGESAVD